MQMLLARKLFGAMAGTMLLIGIFAVLPATASAHSLNAQSATQQTRAAEKISRACDPKMENSTSGARICVAPTKYDNICGGKQWYGPVASHDNHQIGYTYTYGSRHCLTVTWDISRYDLKACTAYMYIPAGHAIGWAQYTSTHAGSQTGSVIEQGKYGTNGVGEFVKIFPVGQFKDKIQLTDQTDYKTQGLPIANQGYHAAQVAWGTEASYSLDLECA